jgi:hypothetical protein
MAASRWTKAGAGAALVLALSSGGVHVARAGNDPTPAPTIEVSPTTLADGQPFTVSGAGCVDPDTGSGEGLSYVVEAPRLGYPNSNNPEGKLLRGGDVAPDGTWSLTVAPDTREAFFGPYEDFETTVSAACLDAEGNVVFAYGAVVVRYDGTAQEGTETTSLGTEPSVPEPAPVAPVPATPAAPIEQQPTFTG